jgi:glycogen operon protein
MRRVACGSPEPLGVTPQRGGVNVAVWSTHATAIEFCLFAADGARETERIALPERTGDVFHGFMGDVAPGARYGLRAHGPFDPRHGHRFNPAKLLIDPYARALDGRVDYAPAMWGGDVAPDGRDSAPSTAKCVVAAPARPAESPRVAVPWADTIVYELHVRGFTKTLSAVPEALRGTCAGLAHPAAIAHLKRLGITTIELMPIVAAVDERGLAARSLTNYWRYNPIAWLVPEPRLAPGGIEELAACVAALHAAGLEVIQDVVLNHSGEGDALGPTLSLRGLDNATYYRTRDPGAAGYVDDTGCGNTLALHRPPVLRLAMDALRHFAAAAGVDGFRFDLATTLGRRAAAFDPEAPLLQAIVQDPVLRELKLIAEPWDVGHGGYQLGSFPATWGEWNNRFRDAVRRFWRGDSGMTGEFATRLAGSSDVFARRARSPSRSINFVTAHDGFTLTDLVSYRHKHNEANGEDNTDGETANHSWNHGVEGPSDDPAISALRRRDVRSLLATLLLARGTPMLSMGDELGRTQRGNNNAYAQDNPVSWIDWTHADEALIDFVGALCMLRRTRAALRDDRWLAGAPVAGTGIPDVAWLCADGRAMTESTWIEPDRKVLVAAFCAPTSGDGDADRAVVAINAGTDAVDVRWPDPRTGFVWRCVLDTSAPSGRPPDAIANAGATSSVAGRSVMVVVEDTPGTPTRRRAAAQPADVARLAAAAGIMPAWRDVDANLHEVPLDTQRALLAAMGLSVNSARDVRARLRELATASRQGPLPAAVVARSDQAIALTIELPKNAMRTTHRLYIRCEDGSERELDFDPAALPAAAPAEGSMPDRRVVMLPALPGGAHELRIDDDAANRCAVIVAPAACHLPPALRRGDRRFGLAAQLYALRRAGDQGIGDFTTLAEIARATAHAGGSLVAINPLHALCATNRERASPYRPSDRRFIDPLYIDLEAVADLHASREARAVLAANSRAIDGLATRGDVDYAAVWRAKRAVLDACFATFDRRPERDRLVAEFDTFVRARGPSLRDFAVFEAIAATYPRAAWQRWPRALRRPATAHASEFVAQHARDVRFAMYAQWLADRQLDAAVRSASAAGLGVGLSRDLATGAAADGAEAWSSAATHARRASIGAPPDTFSPSGQVWHLAPVVPHRLAASGYEAFRELLQANMRHAGALRIDHVTGLARLFWIPEGADPSDGAYVAYPLDDLLGVLALESVRARCLVVGEDLGTVPEALRDRLAAADVLSSRVLWFERDAAGFHPPSRYPVKAAACVSTHDLPTIAGWWSGADIAERAALGRLTQEESERAHGARTEEKALLADALNLELPADAAPIDATAPHDAAISAAIHRHLALSPAALVLVQADDLAQETVAQNLPGTDRERPNWRRKLAGEASALWDTQVGQLTAAACAARRAAPADAEP